MTDVGKVEVYIPITPVNRRSSLDDARVREVYIKRSSRPPSMPPVREEKSLSPERKSAAMKPASMHTRSLWQRVQVFTNRFLCGLD